MDKISVRKDRHFREFCSGVMARYKRNGKWTSEELDEKAYLESLGFKERKTFWHNFKIQNPEQTGYYILDLFLPTLGLNIEHDGGTWHSQMGGTDLKDRVRDNWLKFLGIKTIRVHTLEELKNFFDINGGRDQKLDENHNYLVNETASIEELKEVFYG